MIKGHSEKWRLLQAEHLDRVRAQLAGRAAAAELMRRRQAAQAAEHNQLQQQQQKQQAQSKSRWSFEVKQRELEEAEELRRRAILTIRKAELRDATERFQRATSPRRSRPPSPARQRPSSAPASRLQVPATSGAPTALNAQLGQPVVGVWMPAAASADGRASVAFAKKYGSYSEEQQHPKLEVTNTVSPTYSRKYSEPLQPATSIETLHVHGDSSTTFRQQRRHSAVWAPAWISSTESLPRGKHPSPTAEDSALLGSQSWSEPQPHMPARCLVRPSSAGAVMAMGTKRQVAVASGPAKADAPVEQPGPSERPTVTVPHASVEPCADGEDAADGDVSPASSIAADEWFATDAQPTALPKTAWPHTPDRQLLRSEREAFDFSPSDVTRGPPSPEKMIDEVSKPPHEATLAGECDVISSKLSSHTPKTSSLSVADAANLHVLSHGNHQKVSANGSIEKGSRTAEVHSAINSMETAPAAWQNRHQHAPVPPRDSRPPYLLVRRPASADGARLRASAVSLAPANETAAANTGTLLAPASSSTTLSAIETPEQLPVDAATRFGMYYIKSRTDSRLKQIIPGQQSAESAPLLLANVTDASSPSPGGCRATDRNSNEDGSSSRRSNQIGQPDRAENIAPKSAAVAAATAGGGGGGTAADRQEVKGRAVDLMSPHLAAASTARPRSAPGSRAIAAMGDFFSSAGVDTLNPADGSLVGESENKQPRSILKRPMSGHDVTSRNSIYSSNSIQDAYATSSQGPSVPPFVGNVGRQDGVSRRKSVRFSDDDSRSFSESMPASAFDGMNEQFGSVGVRGGGREDGALSWAHAVRPAVGQPEKPQTEVRVDIVAPANSPVGDTNGNMVVGGQMTTTTTGIATPNEKSDMMPLKREQQPRRVLPPATFVTLQSEQPLQQKQQELVPNPQLAAKVLVSQTWQMPTNKQLLQTEALASASVNVPPFVASPSRAAMPVASVYFPVEEQRLLSALEVLNRRLKINEDLSSSDRGASAQNNRASTFKGHLSRLASQQDADSSAPKSDT